MLLFAASVNVGYYIFTCANEKFRNVFVRAFTKSDATGLHFAKPSYRLENCHATVSLILCCLHDVIYYNDVISATNSLEFVKGVRFTDV